MLLLYFLLFLGSEVTSGTLFSDVAKLCASNNLNFITVSSLPFVKEEMFELVKDLKSHDLISRQLAFEEIPENHIFYQDTLLLLADSDTIESDNFLEYLNLLKITRIRRALLVFTTDFNDQHMKLLKEALQQIQDNALFQVIFRESAQSYTKGYQVISIKTGSAVINPMKLNRFGHILENYNLQVLWIIC